MFFVFGCRYSSNGKVQLTVAKKRCYKVESALCSSERSLAIRREDEIFFLEFTSHTSSNIHVRMYMLKENDKDIIDKSCMASVMEIRKLRGRKTNIAKIMSVCVFSA